MSLMEKRGVTLDLLLAMEEAALASNSDGGHWTMEMLSYALVGNHETLKQGEEDSRWKETPVDPAITLTHASRLSLIDTLEMNHQVEPHPVLKVVYNQVVGQANIFLSFAYQDNFIEMVDAIVCFMESANMPKETTYFWFDTFVNNQWVPLDNKFDWWATTFREAVSAIGHTLLFLTPCLKPTMLTRAWCLYEISCSDRISIALSRQEVAAFQEILRSDYDSIMISFSQINLEKCTAWNLDDLMRIFEAVRDRGGFHSFNVKVKNLLREWIATSALGMISGIIDDQATIDELNDLERAGFCLFELNKLDEALVLYERALRGKKRSLAEDDPSTLNTVQGIAALLSKQNKLDEALVLYKRVLKGQEKSLGVNHLSTLDTVNNIAALLSRQNKFDEALVLYERALRGYGAISDVYHLSTLTTEHNMAVLLYKKNNLDEALVLYERALKGREKSLAEDHPDTLGTVNNIAVLLHKQNKLDEALVLYERALKGREKNVGEDHPDTLDTVNNMANLLFTQNKLDEALVLYERVLRGCEKNVGVDHPSTLSTVHTIANLLSKQNKLDDLRLLRDLVLSRREMNLGVDHPLTVDAVYHLMSVVTYTHDDEGMELLNSKYPGVEKIHVPMYHPCVLFPTPETRKVTASCDVCRGTANLKFFCSVCDFDICGSCSK